MSVDDVLVAVKDNQARLGAYGLYRDYDQGKHAYPYASEAFKSKFQWVLKQARANKCPTVISNFTDRVTLSSWSGSGAQRASDLAEQVGLDRILNLAVKEAWRTGDAYILAWPGRDGAVKPWYHRADQVSFKLAQDDPDEFDWVAKIWVNDDNVGRVNLYYPDRLERYGTNGQVRANDTTEPIWPTNPEAYSAYTGDGDPDTIVQTFGRVPWVHLPLEPTEQGGHGRSILRDVIPLQDGLNHTLVATILGVEQYGSPLRALMNYQAEVRIDPSTGVPERKELRFDETRNRIFGVAGPGPFTQLNPPDSSNLLQVMAWFSTEIANTVGIPVSDIAPDLGNVPSGTALRVLAARRTAAVVDFTDTITPAMSTLMSLLGVDEAYPQWIDPAPMDETERIDAAIARQDLGWPLSENLRELGRDQDDIDRIMNAKASEEANIGSVAVQAFRSGQDPASVIRG